MYTVLDVGQRSQYDPITYLSALCLAAYLLLTTSMMMKPVGVCFWLGTVVLATMVDRSEAFLFQNLFGFGLLDGIFGGKFACLFSYVQLGYDISNLDQYDTYFRDDSVFTLAQTGSYHGIDGIKEYVGFIYNETSDYFAYGAERLATENYVGGLSADGQCEFRSALHSKYILNASVAESADVYEVTSMVKLFLQPSGWFGLPSLFFTRGYLPKANFFLSPGYTNYIFVDQLAGNKTQDYICDIALATACAGVVPTPTDCKDRLAALPKADPGTGFVDGNSMGCRALHASFALKNDNHCAHVALDPTPDPQGNIKCQTSTATAISDLFSNEDLEWFQAFQIEKGFDPEVGFKLIEN